MQAHPPRPRAVLALLGLAVLALASTVRPAPAATVIPLTLEDMERSATDVFVGTVETTRAAWDKDHRLIETTVRIRVDRRVKGRGGPRATVVVPGGVVGDIGMRTPGAPVFRAGERVLLLAEAKRPGALRPVGLFQGKLRVHREAARGIDLVEAPGPAWGARGEPIAHGTIPEGKAPALPLEEVLGRLGVTP